MFNQVRYILLTAQRDFLFFALAIAILGAATLSMFLGSNSLSEQSETSMVFAAGVVRGVLVLGLTIFTAFSISRFFDNREIELMVVRPASRASFVFSFWIGFSMVALLFVLFSSIVLYLFSSPNLEGFLFWSGSLLLETMLILALTMAAALILRSAVSAVMLSLGFYILSRLGGFIMMIVTKPGPETIENDIFLAISAIIPRLDFFAKTEWLVYGITDAGDIGRYMIQAAVFTILLLGIAIYDFQRKEF
jgi:ABC-type transport system involved in multi-copper enzyme maturation permease subunit